MIELSNLWGYLAKHRRRQLLLLLILMFVSSLVEVVSIGTVIPFLGVLSSPDVIFQHQLMQPINSFLNISSANQLLFPMTVFFILAIVLSGLVRLLLNYATIKLSNAIGTDISTDVYRRTLYQEYEIHSARNSSEIINSTVTKVNAVISGIIFPSLNLTSSAITSLTIIITFIVIDPILAVSVFVVFGIFYSLVIFYTKKLLKENSKIIAEQSTQMIKYLQEGLGGIRDILLEANQQFYYNTYRKSDLSLRKASGDNQFIGSSPRYIIEMVGVILIATVAYVMSVEKNSLIAAIPTLGALALGSQKLIPSLQQAYASLSKLRGTLVSLKDVMFLLNQALPDYVEEKPANPIRFNKEINLNNLSFCYKNDKNKERFTILNNVNLKIKKGSKVGFVGKTGSGKSTLIDIIMGLLSPTSGSIDIDGLIVTQKNKTSWQKNIAHVPQDIFLLDGTIEENIAFGVRQDEINSELVRKAAKQSQIYEFVQTLEEGFQTLVGERGARLSGGQIQRVGIARALYKNINVLIFDEATSSLDSETEQIVMEAINSLDKSLTILIVAHRVSTLEDCDSVFELKNGSLYKK